MLKRLSKKVNHDYRFRNGSKNKLNLIKHCITTVNMIIIIISFHKVCKIIRSWGWFHCFVVIKNRKE